MIQSWDIFVWCFVGSVWDWGFSLSRSPSSAVSDFVCNNFCLIIVVWENDLSGQTYLYRIIYRHSQILANTPNIMGTLRYTECPGNIEHITSSTTFSLGVVYSKPLGGKSRIVKLVCEMKKKMVLLPEPYCRTLAPFCRITVTIHQEDTGKNSRVKFFLLLEPKLAKWVPTGRLLRPSRMVAYSLNAVQ